MAEGPFKACAALMAKREDAATTPNPNSCRRILNILPPECAPCAQMPKIYPPTRHEAGETADLTPPDANEMAICMPKCVGASENCAILPLCNKAVAQRTQTMGRA